MKSKLTVTLFAMAAAILSLVACSESDDAPQIELDDVVIEPDTEEPTTTTTLKGLAADGAASITVKIPADSSNPATKITISSDVEWGVITGDETIQSVDDEDLYIFTLTSEETLPAALESAAKAEINYTIEATFADGVTKSTTKCIEVVRPPVIFAHGLASGPVTFDPMLGYIRPMGLFIDEALYALDYTLASLSSYQTNNRVVPEAIDTTLAAMLDAGYVAKKATLIGHSMGGILTRIYMQDGVFNEDGVTQKEPYRDDILKVITIDTPHSGSQLADFALELGENDLPLAIFSKMGAIIDLAVESEATEDLNSAVKLAAGNALEIPTHLISAHMGTLSDVVQLVKDEQYAIAAISFLLNAVGSKYIYGDDTSDVIVPTLSQNGGVENTLTKKYLTTYENEWHCSVHTTEEAANDIVTLLNTESSDNKTFTTGFDPVQLSYSKILTTSSNAIEFEEVDEIPFDGIQTDITIGLDSNDAIISIFYDGIEMGDESNAVAIIEIARLVENTSNDTPHIVYKKTIL